MVFPMLHLAIPCLLSEFPLCSKTHRIFMSSEFIGPGGKKIKPARCQNQKTQAKCIFWQSLWCRKKCIKERLLWHSWSLSLCSNRAMCHPCTAHSSCRKHSQGWFPRVRGVKGMVALPELHMQWILWLGDAALLSTIPVPSLHHRGCTIPVSAASGKAALARSPQQPHRPLTFSGLLGFFQ